VCTFSEHSRPGVERRVLADTIDRDEVDDLDDPPTPVCYYIVGGNREGYFALEPLRHELLVSSTPKTHNIHTLTLFLLFQSLIESRFNRYSSPRRTLRGIPIEADLFLTRIGTLWYTLIVTFLITLCYTTFAWENSVFIRLPWVVP